MTDSLASLRRQLNGAEQLAAVVRAMKAVSAAAIGQYEQAVRALEPYAQAVDLGLSVSLRHTDSRRPPVHSHPDVATGVVVFGSDQGLVGHFNESIAQLAASMLEPGAPANVWCVGERIASFFQDRGQVPPAVHTLPASLAAITGFVSRLLLDIEAYSARNPMARIEVFHQKPARAPAYEAVRRKLLPLDESWARGLRRLSWPTRQCAEVFGDTALTLRALIREHLFIALYRSCAESLAAEHAARLAAMQRAEENIDTTAKHLQQALNRLRQSAIDEELFDLTAGFAALVKATTNR